MQGKRDLGWLVPGVVAVVLLGALGYLVARAAGGADLVDLAPAPGPVDALALESADALAPALLALAAALAALALWLRDRRRAEVAGDAEERIEAAEEARRRERELAARLREKLRAVERERGALGATDDLPTLLLRTTLELVGAEKGLLVSAKEGGGREVLAWENFSSDPRDSALGRRFTEAVLERDEVVREREEELSRLPEGDAAPADREIRNLIAVPIYVSDEFSGVVVCANSEDIERHDEQVLLALGNQAGAILDSTQLRGELREAYVSTIAVLAEAIRIKDPHLGGHSHQVSGYVSRVAERLGMEGREREELVFASLLHDVGKIGISERILLKPGALSSEEYAVVKLHPRIGAGLVGQVRALEPLAVPVLHHHERFDGAGYPTGLRGEEIPLPARIICVADAFSAMTSDRPYRGRMSIEAACEELEANAGTQFDPEVVRLFVEEIRKDPPGEDAPSPVAEVLDDPELRSVRGDDSLLAGTRTLELIDSLTMLYTHRYCHEVAEAQAQRAQLDGAGFAVAMFELSGIKRINSEEGYAAGDAAIKRLAQAVEQAAVRAAGTACRYSGRTIALLVPGAGAEAVEALAANVREAAGELDVTTSCAAWSPGETARQTIERARADLSLNPRA
jgi:diguanylate cyclase (GGDEF)-like protein